MTDDQKLPGRGRSLFVLRELRQRLAAGEYLPETKLPSERTLAAEFKVSRVTIRTALDALKDDGMIDRRAGLGNVVVSGHPVAPTTSPAIGFIIQQLSNPYYSAFASELEEILRNHRLSLTLLGTGQDPAEELRCLQKMSELQVQGVLLCLPDQVHEPKAVEALLKRRLPVVVIGRKQTGITVDTVDSDNRSGVTAAIEHLLELGHTRIGFLGAMAFGRADMRMELTEEILRAKGLEPGRFVRVESPDFAGGRLAFDEFLMDQDQTTAVLCTNDITAVGAVQRAFERGIAVPEKLSIVGYDDIAMASMTTVPLTTVAVPLAELAALAFERLMARAQGYAGNAIHLTVEPRLVVRASTGAPPESSC